MKMMKIACFFFGIWMSGLCMASQQASYDIVVANDGTGAFKTVQEAVNAVPDNQTKRTVIFIKVGVYKEKVTIPSTKKNLTLIGEDVNKTLITYDDFSKKWNGKDTLNTWTSYSFSVEAEGFVAENLTFENSAGRVGQAVAVRVLADKVMFKNCRILGNQDTLFAHGIGRIYFSNCYIEGTTDFIFGSAVALFEKCHIHSKRDSYITAASTPQGNPFGYVFKNCILTADTGIHKVYLGRPWRAYAKTVYINCTMGSHICPEGWDNWRNPDKEKTAFYAEYKCTGPGSNTSARVPWSKKLTDAEATKYTMDQIFSRDSVPMVVVGNWNPLK